MRLPRLWTMIAALAILVLVGGTAAYLLTLRSRPAPLGLAASHPRTPAPSQVPDDPLTLACRQPAISAATATQGLSGLWVIQPGSLVGYRAHEKFAELPSPHEAVARTEQVKGWVLVADERGVPRIETGCVAVDLGSLRSVDKLPGFNTNDRDQATRNFLNVQAHPFAIFQPYPAQIDRNPSTGAPIHVRIPGLLEVNGVSKPANFGLDVRLSNGDGAVAGSTTVDVGDYGVELPTAASGFVSVDPHMTLEISLVLSQR